jgi:hypothetical protein
MPLLVDPFLSFDTISRDEMNRCLEAWAHRMGAIRRPEYRAPIDFVLRHHGKPLVVVGCDTLIRDNIAAQFDRSCAFELSRLCSDPEHYGLCSLAMRLWRAFAYPVIVRSWGTPWAISYQDAASAKNGNLYRFDGWVKLGYSNSGVDPRARPGTASVRQKVIWGWSADSAAMQERRKNPPKEPSWRVAA